MSPSEGGDTLAFKYAERISIVQYDDYTVVKLQNPWDTLKTLHTYVLVDRDRELPPHLPVGTIVRTPLQKAVVFTSVHSSLADVLGKGSSIGGVCDLKYIQLPFIQEGVAKGTATVIYAGEIYSYMLDAEVLPIVKGIAALSEIKFVS
jgi:iron complex transport system substrate-binding protein